MNEFSRLSIEDLEQRRSDLEQRFSEFKSRGLKLDMTRGKPSAEQLDLALDMLACVDRNHFSTTEGADCRNYGGLDGIPEAKKLFSQYLEVAPHEIIIDGNSSLKLMFDTVIIAMVHPVGCCFL